MTGKNIMFIADSFASCGGVETRLYNYCCKLRKKGYRIFIFSQTNNRLALREFINGTLPKNRLLSTLYISILARILNIDIIEMHIKGRGCYKPWFCRARLGIMVHNKTTRATRRFCCTGFDYSFVVSAPLKNKIKLPPHFKILPNAISPIVPCYKFVAQKRAVLVTRISLDKQPLHRSFYTILPCYTAAF